MIFPANPPQRLSGNSVLTDDHWMQAALKCAEQAEAENEVPVGAVIVAGDKIIGEGWNKTIQLHDPSAHAEIIALRHAGQQLKNYRLLDATLYVTLEPCAMCLGAMMHARIKRVVYGTADPKTGALGGAVDVVSLPHWNHQFVVSSGVLADKCAKILIDFFQKRRNSGHD